LQNRERFVAAAQEEIGGRFPATVQVMQEAEMQSLCELPLVAGPRILGSLFLMSSAKAAYGHLQQSFLEQVASAVAVALDDCLAHEEVRRLGNELSARTIAQIGTATTTHERCPSGGEQSPRCQRGAFS